MRGASAVQKVLDEIKTPDIVALIVWEPVLLTDLVPPTTRVLGRIHDNRAIQYWDPKLAVSNHVKRAARAVRQDEIQCIPDLDGGPVWDYISIYPPGATWAEVPLGTSYSGCPVADVIGDVRERLLAAAGVSDVASRRR